MGLAIINQLANYALERKAQNVIPLDSTKRIYLTSVTNFAYNLTPELDQEGNLIYRLQSLNVGTATQPYVYSLLNNPTGASVDPISGVVTVTGSFTGTSLNVILSAVYDNTYYILSGNSFQANALILNILAPVSYSDLRITNFTYNTNSVTADGESSGNPVLSYQYNKSGTTMSTGATVTYKMHTTSDSGATINSNGVVTIPSNSSNSIKVFIVEVTVTIGGLKQTEVARISLAAAESQEPVTPVTYTYAFSNVNLSYTGSPVAATGNSIGLTPTLNYTLTKTGSDNSTETISASSVVYSVNGTKPSNVTLTTSTGKVTFGANGTDDSVSVTIKATLTAPDGTTTSPTASITLDARALTSIAFDKYDGNNTIEITAGDTVYANKIGLTLTYDTGNVTLPASANNNILIAIGSTGTLLSSLTFSEAGGFTMYIYYKALNTHTQVVVNSATAVTKAYIAGISDDPYSINNARAITNGVELPLSVYVVDDQGETSEMLLEDYNDLSVRETYDDPVVTITGTPNILATPGTNGSIVYDFTRDNYVCDCAWVSRIDINCTSGGSNVNQAINYNLKAADSTVARAYFQDTDSLSDNFEEIQLNHLAGQPNEGYDDSVNTTYLTVSSKQLHVSNSSTGTNLKLSGTGRVYELNANNDVYLKVKCHCDFAIITDTASNVALNKTFTLSASNPNVIYLNPDEQGEFIYIHHTPTNSGKTYLIDISYLLYGNDNQIATWYLLVPKNINQQAN